MELTVLMDDLCPRGGFKGEHGLCYLIEAAGLRLLFDLGQTGACLTNAASLGVDLTGIDAVILSHGHYDHTGGLKALYEALAPASPPLYAGQGYAARRFACAEGIFRSIGLPDGYLPPATPRAVELSSTYELGPGVYLMPRAERRDGSSPAPRFRLTDYEDGRLDQFDDELSLVIDQSEGLVVMTGCAHRGIANIAEAALRAFPGRPLAALVGGFHLGDESEAELERVSGAIAALTPARVLCGHCTGVRGYAALASRFERVEWAECGKRFVL